MKRAARIYAYLAALALHAGVVAWYIHERVTCDPTEFIGCFSASLIPDLFAVMVGVLATLTGVVLVVDAGLHRYYTGESR